MISQSDDIINELNRATVFSHLIIFLVLAEDKDMDTDVDASNYVSGDFFADGFLEYLPSGSRTKIESLVPVETYMCRKSGHVAALLLQFHLVVPDGSYQDADMRKYSNVFNELAVVDRLVLRGERIVVVQTRTEAMVKIAHEGHQGIVRTKQLLCAHV